MASTSGIRANGSYQEYSRKPLLKNAVGYGAWRTKMSTILEGEECWDLVQGIELEPKGLRVQVVEDGDVVEDLADQEDIALQTERLAEVKDWKRRYGKAASLITKSIDDSVVQMLDVHNNNPVLTWAALRADYNTVTAAQQTQATHNFLGYIVTKDDTF